MKAVAFGDVRNRIFEIGEERNLRPLL